MVDPLNPNLQQGRNSTIDDPLVDRPRPLESRVPRTGISGSIYLWATVLLLVLLGALYYIYSSGDMTNAPPPPQPATPTAPAPS